MANQFKIGQKVRAKPSLVNWISSHLCWSYGKPVLEGQAGYDKGDKEIHEEDLDTIYVWTRAKLGNKMPSGVVRNYGSEELKDENPKLKRRYVWVDFKFNTELGEIVNGLYVSEKDLDPIKPRSRK